MRTDSRHARIYPDRDRSDGEAAPPGEALSAEELVRRYIARRELQWKRTKRLLSAAALAGVGVLLGAGLVEVLSHSARGKVGERGPEPPARTVSALPAPERIPAPETRAKAEPQPAPAEARPKPADAVPASEPSSTSGPSALQQPDAPAPEVTAALAPPPAPPAIAAGQHRKHSGVIVSVAAETRTITLEEVGPWTGSDSRPHIQTVRLTGRTAITLVSRSDEALSPDGWPGGFRESTAGFADLRPGDFVTVTETAQGDEVYAEAVSISRHSAIELPRRAEGRTIRRR